MRRILFVAYITIAVAILVALTLPLINHLVYSPNDNLPFDNKVFQNRESFSAEWFDPDGIAISEAAHVGLVVQRAAGQTLGCVFVQLAHDLARLAPV